MRCAMSRWASPTKLVPVVCLPIFLQVCLSRDDQAIYKGWDYTCVDDYQQEVVDFLVHRDNQYVDFDSNGGGCCSVC